MRALAVALLAEPVGDAAVAVAFGAALTRAESARAETVTETLLRPERTGYGWPAAVEAYGIRRESVKDAPTLAETLATPLVRELLDAADAILVHCAPQFRVTVARNARRTEQVFDWLDKPCIELVTLARLLVPSRLMTLETLAARYDVPLEVDGALGRVRTVLRCADKLWRAAQVAGCVEPRGGGLDWHAWLEHEPGWRAAVRPEGFVSCAFCTAAIRRGRRVCSETCELWSQGPFPIRADFLRNQEVVSCSSR